MIPGDEDRASFRNSWMSRLTDMADDPRRPQHTSWQWEWYYDFCI